MDKLCIIMIMEHIWEMPEIQGINRLPMGSPCIPWQSEIDSAQDAAAGPELRDYSSNPFYRSLDGIWKFRLMDGPDLVKTDESVSGWQNTDFDDSEWFGITVPGTWTRQGFDKPHYTNVIMPFENVPPHVPEQNPTGLYRLSFDIPAEWQDRRIVLHVGSAESCAIIWVDGKMAGAAKDTRLPSEFDITQFLCPELSEHTLCIMCVRYSDASFVEDQDQWWFGGLHRSVYLYTTEDTWIQDIEAPATLEISENGTTGTIPLKITVGINEILPRRPTRTISWTVRPIINPHGAESLQYELPALGEPVASDSAEITCYYRENMNQYRTAVKVDNPLVWSHENPNRYVLTVMLSEDDRLIQSESTVIGFRSVVTGNRELRINDALVYIKGANRHEHNEFYGKTLTTEEMVRDIFLLKSHNFNAVRTCHYPDDERWYELCDKYGIYLIDEANIENHYYYDGPCRDEMYANAYMTRVQRMVRRDKNHPSIILWSLGNESGCGPNQAMMYAWCHAYDKSRPVHYEGGTRAEYRQSGYSLETFARGKEVSDIVCPMYPDYHLLTDWAANADSIGETRPFIMCEYSHAMGNSNGSLAEYWRLIRSTHGLQGGFIWDWIDQGLAHTDENGKSYWRYGGDFGESPTDWDFCINGLLLPNQEPKPAMQECKKLFQPAELVLTDAASGTAEIENRLDFTALDALQLRWYLLCNGEIRATDTVSLPAAAPTEKATVVLPYAETLATLKESGISGEWVIHVDYEYTEDFGMLSAGTVAGWSEAVLEEAPAVRCPEKPASGLLQAARTEALKNQLETQVLSSALKPSLFRCPTENDAQKTLLYRGPDPNRAGFAWIEKHLDKVQLLADGSLAIGNDVIGSLKTRWTSSKTADGRQVLEMSYTYSLDESLPELPKIGFTAHIPADLESVRWYGAGEHESYNDRHAGSPLGLYTKHLSDMEQLYVVPQENGNRFGVRFAELLPASKKTDDEASFAPTPAPVLRIEADKPFQFSVLHHEPMDLWKCRHPNELTDTAEATDTGAGYYILNLDIAQRGIGSATCGPDTEERFRVRPGVYSGSFRFIF